MPANEIKVSYLTVEPTVKRYVYSQTVVGALNKALEQGEEFIIPAKPNDVGELANALAFPRIYEIDMAGQVRPATPMTVEAFLLGRLRSGGIEAVGPGSYVAPSKAYNAELLAFHLDQLVEPRAQSELLTYLRRLLLEQTTGRSQSAFPDVVPVLEATLGWLESYGKTVQARRLQEARSEEPAKRIGYNQKALAYKLLIVKGHINLPNRNDIYQQVEYIAEQTGAKPLTIRRYLNSNLTPEARERTKEFIYTEEHFEQALRFIRSIRPDIDTDIFRLSDVSKR